MPLTRKTVMISSTARDLPEHRKEVMNACLSQGMFPMMMEHLPANDDDAISASLKMVDEADIYVGVYAQRYGYIPKGKKRNPKQISITEMEYDHAVKRKIPCLLFVMDKSHPITIDDIDMENAAKLKKFKDRIQIKNVVNFFKSPTELRAHVLNSLSKYLEATPVTILDKESATLDVTAYFNALRKRYNVLALEGLTPPQKEEYLQIQLRSVFVEQSVREDTPPVELPKEVWEKLSREQEIHAEDLPSGITLEDVRQARDSYYQKPSRLVLEALTDARNQYTIILGDPGSGKSTLARYVMLSLIDPLLADDKIQKAFDSYLPLLIELRTFAGLCAENKCDTPLEFLEHLGKTEGWGLTQTALHQHLKNDGRALVIFDGLDEIFEPKLRETVTNQIVGFTNAYPKARVIVTSRILGYRRKILSDAGFTHFTLQDLDEKQVEAFITKWYQLAMSDRLDEAKERSERILKSFKDSASIRQLAGNPMLLTIMAIIGKHQELPRERWKLYDHAASVLIQHWDVNKHLKDENLEADFIGEDDKKELLRRLAYRMQSGEGGLAGNYIHREDLQKEFESYLKERYSQTPERAKLIAGAMIQQFRERNFILSLYGANLYGFVHRAFLEYFCASAFVWKFEKTKELSIEQLKTDVYGKHWEDQSWHEVLRLICGMIDEKWTDRIIIFLSSEVFRPWPDEFRDRLPLNIVLGIQCLGESRNTILLADAGGHLLLDVMNLFDTEQTEQGFLGNKIVPTVELLGSDWPQRETLSNLLMQINLTQRSLYFSQSFGRTVASIGKELVKVRDFLITKATGENTPWRQAALCGLAYGWNDQPQILDLLCNAVLSDVDDYLRWSAIMLLHECYEGDDKILNYFQECALYDKDGDNRRYAVRYLGEDFKPSKCVFLLLRKLAVTDNHGNVRSESVSALAERYREEAGILPLLRERAVQDIDSGVRGAAVSALAEHYREDAGTLLLLRDRAVQDESPKSDEKQYQGIYVRETAINAIAKYWRDHPDTLPLLRERAKKDPSPWLRKRARELIKEIEGEKE